MDAGVPFCEECGRVGMRLSGLHVDDTGLMRWTLYKCGHVTTQIVLDEVLTADS